MRVFLFRLFPRRTCLVRLEAKYT